MAMVAKDKDPKEFAHLTQRAASLAKSISNVSIASNSSLSKSEVEEYTQNNGDDCYVMGNLVDDL